MPNSLEQAGQQLKYSTLVAIAFVELEWMYFDSQITSTRLTSSLNASCSKLKEDRYHKLLLQLLLILLADANSFLPNR